MRKLGLFGALELRSPSWDMVGQCLEQGCTILFLQRPRSGAWFAVQPPNILRGEDLFLRVQTALALSYL